MIDMTKFKGHTPGPLRVGTAKWSRQAVFKGNFMVADFAITNSGRNLTEKEMEANAALFAASPELLAEVERLQVEIEKLQKRIAKAEGILTGWAEELNKVGLIT